MSLPTTRAKRRRERKLRPFAVLYAAAKYWRAHHYAPTNRELQIATGLSSISLVQGALRELKKRRHITLRTGAPRTLLLTPAGWAVTGLTPPRLDEEPPKKRKESHVG